MISIALAFTNLLPIRGGMAGRCVLFGIIEREVRGKLDGAETRRVDSTHQPDVPLALIRRHRH